MSRKIKTKQEFIKHRIEVQKEMVQNSSYFCAAIPEDERMNTINECMFKSVRKYVPLLKPSPILSTEDAEQRLRFALTINRNMQSLLGFSMDQNLLTAFAHASIDDQKEEYGRLCNTIKTVLGVSDFQKSRMFYPGFPEEVMSKSDAELYLNAAIYYMGTYGLGIHDFASLMADAGLIQTDAPERTPLTEVFERSPQYINSATIQDFHDLMKQRMHGNGLSASNRDFLLKYAATWTDQFKHSVAGKFQSKENEALVVSWLHDHNFDNVVFNNNLCKDSTDILRVISVISQKNGARNGRITRNTEYQKVAESPERLLTPKSFEVRLSKTDKKFVKELMNKCQNLCRDMWSQESYWKKVMRNIDARKGPDKVVRAFNNLSSGIKKDEHGVVVETQHAIFVRAKESMKKENDVMPMVQFAKHNPGLFLQKAANVMSIASNDQKPSLISALSEAAIQVDPAAALKTYNAIRQRQCMNTRVVRNHSRVLQKTDNEPIKLSELDAKNMQTALMFGVQKSLSELPTMGKVYIDPVLDQIKVPQRQDIKGSDGATVSTGSLIPCDKNKNLVLAGISWNKKGLDLDLHATPVSNITDLANVNIDEDHTITYANLRETWGIHSGDFTSGDPFGDGKGAQEFIVFNKDTVKQQGYDYIIFDIYGFNEDLHADDTIRSVFMEREGNYSDARNECAAYAHDRHEKRPVFCGEVVEPSVFEESVKLNAKGHSTITFAYDVKNDGFIWLDEPLLGHRTREFSGLYGDNAAKCLALLHAIQNPEPTLGQLFRTYAEATHAEIVTDMTVADMICTYKPIDAQEAGLKDNAITINSMEKEKIYEEFCHKQSQPQSLVINRPFAIKKPEMIEHVESIAKNTHHERVIDNQMH